MNRVVIVGNLTRDPELKKTKTDISVCTFTVAANRRPKDDGTREADFLNVVVWRGQAESCYRYLKKGRRVAVSGSIRTRSYDKDGDKRTVWEIEADEVEFLSSAQKEEREETYDFPF